jgi:phage gp37-like protein
MISTYTTDLVEKLKTVTTFGGRVAATLGGSEADPALAMVDTPAAWVVFSGMQNTDRRGERFQLMRLNFDVVLIIEYGSGEDDFVNTQLQLIDDASQAVRGEIVADTGTARWAYESCRVISINPDRVIYQLNFSADAAYSKQLT